MQTIKAIHLFPAALILCASSFTAGAADTNIIGWRWLSSTIETNAPQMPTNVIALAGSDYHCVALLADRTVRAWGRNINGETNVPPGLSNVIGIAAGDINGLAATADGTVRMWGRMASTLQTAFVPAQATNVVALGVGRGALHSVALRADGTVVNWGWASAPVPADAFNIVSVAAGSYHALALRSDGRVISWGIHQNPVPASATNIVAIAAGDDTSVAVRADGRLLTWGNISTPPNSLTNVVEVGCFQNQGGIGLRGNGTVTGWGALVTIQATNIMTVGADTWGALAVKAAGPPIFPIPAVKRTVASGQTAYLRHRAVGALPMHYQWNFQGTNLPGATNSVLVITNVSPGKTGFYSLIVSNALEVTTNSDMQLAMVPILIASQSTNQAVYVGAHPTLSIAVLGQSPTFQWSLNGTSIPWGTNSSLTMTNIQLSDAGTFSVSVSNEFGGVISSNTVLTVWPILVTQSPQDQVIVQGGTTAFSIAAQASSPLSYQWRFNGTNLPTATGSTLTLTNVLYAEAGAYEVIASTASASVTNSVNLSVVPVAAWGLGSSGRTKVPTDLTNLVALSAGSIHNLALRNDGSVRAWGIDSRTNVPMDLTNAAAVSAGEWGSLALRKDGTISAWTWGNRGQTNVPVELTNVVAVSAGGYHNLALKSDGTVAAWGQNDSGQTNVPTGLSNVVAIAGGDFHSLALKSDGTVVAWGSNLSGKTNVPAGLTNVVAIAAGYIHSLALRADGTPAVWGSTDYGLPNVPASATNVVAIGAGYGHCLALRDDGTVIAWGYHYNGETNIPTGLRAVTAISSGDFYNLALVGEGASETQALVADPRWSVNGFSVTAPTISGRVYRLEHKDNLSDVNWIAHPLVGGTGGIVSFTDPTATGSQRFYRVRRW